MMDPKMTMEVPPQVREFAEKSVDQAEKAISSFIESRHQVHCDRARPDD